MAKVTNNNDTFESIDNKPLLMTFIKQMNNLLEPTLKSTEII